MAKQSTAPDYFMPAEWELHSGTWLAWPSKLSDWPGRFAPIAWVYGEIVRTLSRFETVNVLVQNARQKAAAERVLTHCHADQKNVQFYIITTNRSWLRDSGPTFVRNAQGQVIALDWRFNAWAKYPDWKTDDRVAAAVAKKARTPVVQPVHNEKRVVLEGGGIEVNGTGLLLTTEEWALSDQQQRNPGFSREDYEQTFARYLGIEKVLWLNRGIVGDDTHGHIDDLARFVNANTIVTVVERNPSDANYEVLQENQDRLKGMKDQNGRRLTIVELPMPAPLVFRGQRLPASYANFYIANDVVMVPTFNDTNDRIALGILAELFPGRSVIGINCVELVWGLGTLHCLTQQQPA